MLGLPTALFFVFVGIMGIVAGLGRLPWLERQLEEEGIDKAKETKLRKTLLGWGAFVLVMGIMLILLKVLGVFFW